MLIVRSKTNIKDFDGLFIVASLLVLIMIGLHSSGWADPATGTEYLSFWSGELRIFAQEDNTEVLLIDIDTGSPLSLSDGRINSLNVSSNPFVLASAGDSFEGIGGLGGINAEIRIRITTADSTGGDEQKAVTVWTGYLASSARHPSSPPTTTNPWMSYIPAFNGSVESTGTEIGRNFLGFTSREMYIFAQKGPEPTTILIEDLVTNTDTDSDDTITLVSADAIYADLEIEVFFLNSFEDDTVLITSNVDASVLVGLASTSADDWTATPPSYAAGDDGIELGTLFYTFAHRSLTVFPTEDQTNVTITDLSDNDDSTAVVLTNGDTLGDYDLYTPTISSSSYGNIIPRSSAPEVNIFDAGTNQFDDDFVRIESDKPVLVYVGPVASDVDEFADIAFSVPTGPDSRIIYTYAQDSGSSNDLQIFGFSPDTIVTVTSLSYTDRFKNTGHHDHLIGPGLGTAGWKKGTVAGDVWWGTDTSNGEMLRIESTKPITVINGDYDRQSFGAFIPFTLSTPTLPPVAVASAIPMVVCSGEPVSFDGTSSYDQDTVVGAEIPNYTWDFDITFDSDSDGDPANDVDATGPAAVHTYSSAGTFTARLLFVDDDGQSDTDFVEVTVELCQPECEECQGGMTQLTLLYTNPEGLISVRDDDFNLLYGPTQHGPGDTFTIDGIKVDGTLGTAVIIYVDGEKDAEISTDCCQPDEPSSLIGCPPTPSPCQPMGIGLVVRGFEIIDGSSLEGGKICPFPACSDCDGGLVRLTLRYTGDDGNVVVYNDAYEVLFDGSLASGETFTFNGPPSDGKMGNEITLQEDNVLNSTIDSSCSSPIGSGLVVGDFEVLDGYSFAGGKLPLVNPCLGPADCDDDNLCTDDLCDACGVCSNLDNTAPCDDGDVCTMIDMCSYGICSGVAMDWDGDTYLSDACGGNDCDDANSLINPGATEIIGNEIDDDCNPETLDVLPVCFIGITAF